LDFTGQEHYLLQLEQYVKAFDISEFETLLNLQEWAKTRGILCTVIIKKRFSFLGLLLRFLILLYPYLKEGLPPVKKEKSE